MNLQKQLLAENFHAIKTSFEHLPDVFAVLDKEASVSHGNHGKEHAQAEVVHEAEVLLDVAGRCVADVESQGEEAVNK